MSVPQRWDAHLSYAIGPDMRYRVCLTDMGERIRFTGVWQQIRLELGTTAFCKQIQWTVRGMRIAGLDGRAACEYS